MCIRGHAEGQSGAARRHTLLVVEDHERTRDAIRGLLQGAVPNAHVFTAESAERAFRICELDPPDVVIMDISLPGTNGIEATRHIRRLSPLIQVVIYSNNDMPIFRDASAAAGACAFVRKGSKPGELVSIILRTLHTSQVDPAVGP